MVHHVPWYYYNMLSVTTRKQFCVARSRRWCHTSCPRGHRRVGKSSPGWPVLASVGTMCKEAGARRPCRLQRSFIRQYLRTVSTKPIFKTRPLDNNPNSYVRSLCKRWLSSWRECWLRALRMLRQWTQLLGALKASSHLQVIHQLLRARWLAVC